MRNVALLGLLALLTMCWEWGCRGMGGVEGKGGGFVVLATGNWLGHLEPCGCADKQLGGVHLRSHILGKVAVEGRLLLDTGPLVEGDDRQSQLKLETFLQSLKRLGYDGIALTGEEIVTMWELGVELGARPVVIGTDVGESVRQEMGLVGYVEKELAVGKRRLECLVLGVSGAGSVENERVRERLALADPVEAVREALAERGLEADEASEGRLVVVLLSGVSEEVTEGIAGLKGVDVVLGPGIADEPTLERPVEGGAAVVTTGELGKYVARLDLGSEAAEGQVASFKTIGIEDSFPKDAAIAGLLDQYQMRLVAEHLVENLPRLSLGAGEAFVGNDACKTCHQEIYNGWNTFGHAHAMATLIKADRDHDPECVSCHTVGMRYETGYRSMESTPELADVGCEMCHGPGKGHRADPHVTYQEVFTTCEDCHTSEHSPAFTGQREAYFERIRHWKGDRRYWR